MIWGKCGRCGCNEYKVYETYLKDEILLVILYEIRLLRASYHVIRLEPIYQSSQ